MRRFIAYTAMAVFSLCLCAPCAALSLQRSVGSLVDRLALEFLGGRRAVSRVAVGVLPIKDESVLARRHDVGFAIQSLVERCVSDSTVFRLVDRGVLESSLKEIELSLSDGSGEAKLSAGVIDRIRYLMRGTVTEDGDRFNVVLRLIEVGTTATVAVADSSFPIMDFVAYGELLFKPFGFAGAMATAFWDLESLRGSTYGDFPIAAGIEALCPVGPLYLKGGAFALYSEGSRDDLQMGQLDSSLAAGGNRVEAACAYAGFGVIFPISRGAYAHAGLEAGLGADRKRSLYRPEDSNAFEETDLDNMEGCIYFALSGGAAFRLATSLALDLLVGVGGIQLGVFPESTAIEEGHLFVPLRLALCYAF